MATTNAEPIPTSHTNGVIEDGLDEDDKMKMRPADIDADVREMERRKRVELIMNSRLFREELERIIESQMRDGNNSAGLLQRISDMVGSKYNNHFLRNASCAVPINDIRGLEAMGFVKGEKILRCKLAALFRLIDLYGWSQNIYNHVTARLSHQEEHFLVNPYGLLYSEVTASSLAKIDMQGGVIESGTTNFNVSVAGFKLHAAIYAFRPDLKCIVHLHTPSVLAISSLKDGLLPLCQEAAVIGDVSLYAYTGTPTESEERDKIARSLGPNNKVIFLTNHGALCCGETIEETFFNAYNIVSACETQLKVLPLGKDNLLLLSDETRKSMYDGARKMPENITPATSNATSATAVSEKRWRVGGLEFEALMRMLDNAGFRTGYIYRTPLIKGELPRPRNDVEVPPAVSSLGYLFEEEEMYNKGLWRKHFGNKGNDRIRWLNSPNVYQKVEILETGTTDPRKITKWVGPNNEEWVAEGSPSHTSTPVKIENALQFVPKNTNPKEFKKLQQQIKDNRRADKITSGPQSHILEGVSWEEAKKLQDANMSGTSDQVILVGAASKGIIQREYQHNATVYKTPYAKNPFDAMTDEELENYKKDIDRKQRGSSYYDEDESDSLPVKGVTSETEDDSLAHDTRVIRIQTSTAPKESRAEVVLSDDGKKSKSKFMQSLGSMLSLRRELASSFVDQVGTMYTSVWEMRLFHPAARLIATVQVVSCPSAIQKPVVVRLSADGDDEIGSLDQAMIRSFDSSEVEITTYTEIRSPLASNALLERRSESPHDFSSSANTEDEDDALSSPASNASGLKASLSASSLTSCIGAEYEEWKAPPPLSLSTLRVEMEHEVWKKAYLEDVPELTTSFKSASDDTSAEDVTVIYRPASGESAGKDDLSDDDLSITDGMSTSFVSEDGDLDEHSESTYSSYGDFDYDEHMPPAAFQYAESAAPKCKETKFYTDLSIIYEEERDRSTSVAENETNEEGTENSHSAFAPSGYESASTLETDSLEMDDSATNVNLSPGQSEMTWTIDDLSSAEETYETGGLMIAAENDDAVLADSAMEGASFENESDDSDRISCTEDERTSLEANEACLTEDECLSRRNTEHETYIVEENESIGDCDIVEEDGSEALLKAGGGEPETIRPMSECGETEQVPLYEITAEECLNALEVTHSVNSETLAENERVEFAESEDSPERDDCHVEDQNDEIDQVVPTDTSCLPLDKDQNGVALRNEHLDFESNNRVENESKLENGVVANEDFGNSAAQIEGNSANEQFVESENALTPSISAENKPFESSPLERTILLSHLLLTHVQSYMQRNKISAADMTSVEGEPPSAEVVTNLPSLRNVPSPETPTNDSSVDNALDCGAALTDALENVENADDNRENKSFQSSAASLMNSEMVLSRAESLDCAGLITEHRDSYKGQEYQEDESIVSVKDEDIFESKSQSSELNKAFLAEDVVVDDCANFEPSLENEHRDGYEELENQEDASIVSVEHTEILVSKSESSELNNGFLAEDVVIDDCADLEPSLEESVTALSRQNSFSDVESSFENKCNQNTASTREESIEFDISAGAIQNPLSEEFVTVERSFRQESIHEEHLRSENGSTVEKENQLCEGSSPSLEISEDVIGQTDNVLPEGSTNLDEDTLKEENQVYEEHPITPSLKNSMDTTFNRNSSDSDKIEKVPPVSEAIYDENSDQNELKDKSLNSDEIEEVFPLNEDKCDRNSDKNELEDESSNSDGVEEVLPLNEENCDQNSDQSKFEDDESSDSDEVEEVFSLNDEYYDQKSDQNQFDGDLSDSDEVEEVLSLNEENCDKNSDENENLKTTCPETESFNVSNVDQLGLHIKPDCDNTSPEEISPQQNAKASSDMNSSSISCKYDHNQNEIPADADKNTDATQLHTNSVCGDFKLTLSLHIEWDDKSTLPVTSSGESSPVGENVNDGEQRSSRADEESLNESDSDTSPHRYIRSLYILKDFKQNYPKFIQYSDFSPKINSRSKRTSNKWPFTTPHRKRAPPTAASTGKGRADRSRQSSADSCGYHRYSELTADWPPSQPTEATSAELPASKKSTTCSSNFDLKFGAHLWASTPKGNRGKGRSSSNRTSLEEFEFYESLYDTS